MRHWKTSIIAATIGGLCVATYLEAAPLLNAEGLEQYKSRGAVLGLLHRVAGDAYDGARVGDFRLSDLDADGEEDLLVSLDLSGREFFNTLVVVWDIHGERARIESIDVWNMESIADAVADLNLDGRSELIVRKELTPYSGAGPMATWTDVYTTEDGNYVEAASRFREFYETNILPSLERRGGGRPLSQERSYKTDAVRLEYTKVLRALLVDPSAGLNDALVLASSEDPKERVLALGVLPEFSLLDATAFTALTALAHDQDPEVAALARARREVLEP